MRYEDEGELYRYDGEWRDDCRNGQGRETFENGDFYEGGWKNNKKHGTGVFVYTSQRLRYEV